MVVNDFHRFLESFMPYELVERPKVEDILRKHMNNVPKPVLCK